MANITAAEVNKLRKMTGAGMMDCKKALVESEGDFDKAIEIDPDYENAIYNLGVNYVKWGTAMNKEAEAQGVISDDYKKKYEMAVPHLEKVVEKM
mgnify:CR=1 FL=1